MCGLDSLNELTKPTKPLIKILDTDKSKKENEGEGKAECGWDYGTIKPKREILVAKQKQYTIHIENMRIYLYQKLTVRNSN